MRGRARSIKLWEQLKAATAIPNDLTSGQLRMYPFWDELRGDPRFDQIVAPAGKPWTAIKFGEILVNPSRRRYLNRAI